MKYTPLNYKGFKKYLVVEEELFDGLHYLFMFDNGYYVSVIKHMGSYGHDKDLFELMINTPDDRDLEPNGWLTNEDVLEKLKEVKMMKNKYVQ